MRNVLLLLGLALTSVAWSQESSPSEPLRWSVQATGSAALTYRTLLNRSGLATNDVIIERRDDMERMRTCPGGQVLLMRSLRRGWAVGFGLSYAQYGFQSSEDVTGVTFGDLVDPRRGFIYNTGDQVPNEIHYMDDLRYAGVCLRVEHTWGEHRFHGVLGLSVSPMFLTEASTVARYDHPNGATEQLTVNRRSDFRSFNPFVSVDAGCAFDVNARLQVRMLPCAKLGTSRIIDAPISARIWATGLQAGASWRF